MEFSKQLWKIILKLEEVFRNANIVSRKSMFVKLRWPTMVEPSEAKHIKEH